MKQTKPKLVAIFFISLLSSQAAVADHFNQNNIIEICSKDSSFDSACYTYIAAYKDILRYLSSVTDGERAKSLCLLNVPTETMASQLPSKEIRYRGDRIVDLLVNEFCD